MMLKTNECRTRMWADKYHRPEFTKVGIRERDGANLLEGVMRADTPEAAKAKPRPSDVPFRIAIPAGLSDWDFHQVNTNIFYRLQNGDSLMDLDYAPPAPVQAEPNWGGILLLGLLGVVAVGTAFGSRN
jgi:hypothetical protein